MSPRRIWPKPKLNPRGRGTEEDDTRETRTITGRDGATYTYGAPRQGKGAAATGLGILTGLPGCRHRRGGHAATGEIQ